MFGFLDYNVVGRHAECSHPSFPFRCDFNRTLAEEPHFLPPPEYNVKCRAPAAEQSEERGFMVTGGREG